jgi:proton-translocating NADH-quinone oxidoreductase chain L
VTSLAPLVPLFPLLGAIIAAVCGKKLKELSHWPVVIGIALAFLVSFSLYRSVDESHGKAVIVPVYEWFHAGDLRVPFEFRVDGLSTMMITMVTFVATIIAIYASGYMHGDPAYPRFFALVGLFVFSMTGLVLSNNFVLTYAFWEGVGVCSYMLVGFWHAKPAAAAAAKKAFLVNRIGDVGFAIALFWMWTVFGHSLSYDTVLNSANIAAIDESSRWWIAFLLFWAATAKSAQVPLYVWLPDAMEGPTPVSALIHAATMVTAGVYLIARSSLLIVTVPSVQMIVAVIGCVTALLAALIALTQTDLKRVMAYSTVSQLGYMFMALGSGVGSVMKFAVVAAMFHLFTHAFFKALLFLASGSVMHAMGGVIDMRRFSGLRKRLPITCWTFAAGGLALAGFPLTAGFFSKDEILAALNKASSESANGWVYSLIYFTALLTAFLTAFYTFRAFFMTFFGPERLPSPNDPEAEPVDPHAAHGHDDHGHDASHFGHESPPVMTVPLMILAVFALFAGLAFGATGQFEHHISLTEGLAVHEEVHSPDYASMALGTIAGLGGLALAWFFYARPNPIPKKLAGLLGGRPYCWSLNKFYVDEAYDTAIVMPTRGLAAVCRFLDEHLVGGIVELVAWVPRALGRSVLGPLQNGLVQYYAAVTALSVVGLLLILLLF